MMPWDFQQVLAKAGDAGSTIAAHSLGRPVVVPFSEWDGPAILAGVKVFVPDQVGCEPAARLWLQRTESGEIRGSMDRAKAASWREEDRTRVRCLLDELQRDVLAELGKEAKK